MIKGDDRIIVGDGHDEVTISDGPSQGVVNAANIKIPTVAQVSQIP